MSAYYVVKSSLIVIVSSYEICSPNIFNFSNFYVKEFYFGIKRTTLMKAYALKVWSKS